MLKESIIDDFSLLMFKNLDDLQVVFIFSIFFMSCMIRLGTNNKSCCESYFIFVLQDKDINYLWMEKRIVGT